MCWDTLDGTVQQQVHLPFVKKKSAVVRLQNHLRNATRHLAAAASAVKPPEIGRVNVSALSPLPTAGTVAQYRLMTRQPNAHSMMSREVGTTI